MRDSRHEHPAVVRLCHWSIALSLAVLIPSGVEVFAAFPSFGDKVPQHDLFAPLSALRLGGWLGGALQWHFAFAWLLTMTMASYLVYQAITRNGRQVLFVGRDVVGVWPMVRHYVCFAPKPTVAAIYNPLQKLAYSTVVALAVISIVTGFALYKPVHLSWLADVMGGFRLVRVWHFASMCGVLAFIPGHLVMVALHGWKNFASMWTGR
jgi:thiosulfate reductase cytochrome b subunit